jgi:hypothetical protein
MGFGIFLAKLIRTANHSGDKPSYSDIDELLFQHHRPEAAVEESVPAVAFVTRPL